MMDVDQLGMAQKMAAGVDLSENGQAMDAIRQVGPGSHYLGCDHTQANFQSAFYRSSIADNNSFEQWQAEARKRAEARANELARAGSRATRRPRSTRHSRRAQRFRREEEGVDARRLHLKGARFRPAKVADIIHKEVWRSAFRSPDT